MTDKYDFDVAVIGAGPAGYVASIRAAQLGARTCVIEKGELGGVCTNVGCIPTKALWHAARVLLQVRRAREFGVGPGDIRPDFRAAAARRTSVVERLRGGIKALLAGNKVELVRAEARFRDAHTLHVEGPDLSRDLTARRIIVATGSRSAALPMAPFDHRTVVDSGDAVLADELPESVLIVGGGYIGVEFAGIYSAFGVPVTIVEAAMPLSNSVPMSQACSAGGLAASVVASAFTTMLPTKLRASSTSTPVIMNASPTARSVSRRLPLAR